MAALGGRPLATMRMVLLAMKMGWKSDRGLLRHIAFAIEATVLARWSHQDNVRHLHAHFGTNSAAIAMLAGQLSGVPYSFTAHGSEEFEKAVLLSRATSGYAKQTFQGPALDRRRVYGMDGACF